MRHFRLNGRKRGFTLIELLIVIAIILILIAIALPNFLEAQVRARITKAKGELRTLATALLSYSLDWKLYPARGDSDYGDPSQPRRNNGMRWLTSPIAYITSLPDDPFPQSFKPDGGDPLQGPPFGYTLTGVDVGFTGPQHLHPHAAGIGLLAYVVYSAGPDSPTVEPGPGGCMAIDGPNASYAPTNGTKSRGDLMLMGGEGRWMGYPPETNRACGPINRNITPPGVVYDGVPLFGSFPSGLTIGT